MRGRLFTSYRRVLAVPGARAFCLTGLAARLPISMVTLGIVLLVTGRGGSYAEAGQVCAAYILANALVAIGQGRLADRWGQARLLVLDACGFAIGLAFLIVAVERHLGLAAVDAGAVLTGLAIPQVGSMTRARWVNLLPDVAARHTAFALESVGDEVIYVIGPAVVTVVATTFPAPTGLLLALLVGTTGPLALAAQRATQPPRHPRPPRGSAPLAWRTLLPLTVCAAALGTVFGALDVATVARASDLGHRPASGWLLALLSLGSLLAGIAAGARTWKTPLRTRLRVGLVLLTIGFVLISLAGSLLVLAPAMLLAGVAIAPTLIAAFSLLEETAPRSRLTESLGFLQTGVSTGIAPGALLAGVVADHSNGSPAYLVSAAAGALACAAAWWLPGPGRDAARR